MITVYVCSPVIVMHYYSGIGARVGASVLALTFKAFAPALQRWRYIVGVAVTCSVGAGCVRSYS